MNSVSLEVPLAPGSGVGPTKSFLALTAGAFPVTPASAAQLGLVVSADFESAKTDERTPSRQVTSFAKDVVEHLERNDPGVLAWLRTFSGVVFQVLLVLVYIIFETIAGLLKSFVLKPEPGQPIPLPSSLIVMNSGISIVVGFWISFAAACFSNRGSVFRSVSSTFVDMFQWRHIHSYSLIAALFSIAGVFSMLAYTKLDAGLKKVLDQLRLPITAAMSAVVLGKRYSVYEWMCLVILLMAVCNFYFVDMARDEISDLHSLCKYPPECFDEPAYDVCGINVDGPMVVGVGIKERRRSTTLHSVTMLGVNADKTNWAGLLFNLLATILNCLASLIFERVVKKSFSTPFPVQKTQIELTAFPVALAMSFIVPLCIDSDGGKAIWWEKTEAEGSGEGLFQGYQELTFVIIGMDVFLAWMSGFIVKQFSSVVRLIAKCFILLLTVLSTGTFLKACHEESPPMSMYALSLVTACSTVLFATMPSM